MTTSPTPTCNENGLSTAGPWTQRNLELGEKILEDLKIAKANKRTADAAEKQAMATFKHAVAEGIMHSFFDDLSEEYTGSGISVTSCSTSRYSEKSYSEALQNAMKDERANGVAQPTVSESFRVKLTD